MFAKVIVILIFEGILSIISFSRLYAQEGNYAVSREDSSALENVFVEKYYIATLFDYTDTTGGTLPQGAVTYRIFLDLKPGYFLQVVYGNSNHELFIKTTTSFFNNNYNLAATGFNISPQEINSNTVALDSWITLGAATRVHSGIPLTDDTDGSVLKRPGFNKADGLTIGNDPTIKQFNLDLSAFYEKSGISLFHTNNGGWAALEGARGPTADNKILIAQITTNGVLSFAFNIQIGTPSKGTINFVPDNPKGKEIPFSKLKSN